MSQSSTKQEYSVCCSRSISMPHSYTLVHYIYLPRSGKLKVYTQIDIVLTSNGPWLFLSIYKLTAFLLLLHLALLLHDSFWLSQVDNGLFVIIQTIIHIHNPVTLWLIIDRTFDVNLLSKISFSCGHTGWWLTMMPIYHAIQVFTMHLFASIDTLLRLRCLWSKSMT